VITKELTKLDIGRKVIYNKERIGVITSVFPKIRVARVSFKNEIGFCDVSDLDFKYVKA
jgi:hypothetical protein